MTYEFDFEPISSNGRLLAQLRLHNDGQTVLRDRVDLSATRSREAFVRQVADTTDLSTDEVRSMLLELSDRQASQRAVESRPSAAPTDPHRLAEACLAARWQTKSGDRTLVYWRDQWYVWTGSSYDLLSDGEFRSELTRALKSEADRLADEGVGDRHGHTIAVTKRLTADVEAALASIVQLPDAREQPFWIHGDPLARVEDIVPLKNGLLNIDALLNSTADAVLPPTPTFFTTSGLDFAYDPTAQCPGWREFLRTVWPDDESSIVLVQEWLGYCVVPDTSQQKILLMVGPPRSGKGTIMRVQRQLVGAANVAGPSLADLQGAFGLQPLLGKLLAVISDARITGRAPAIVERLLSISGEDAVTVNRKNKPMLTTKLNARIAIVSNELPDLRDVSGALASRLLILRTTQSWLGRENTGLTAQLLRELPGILNWSIEGLRRLRQRSHFVQPESSAELAAEMHRLTSPVHSFLEDNCVIDRNASIRRDALYLAYQGWCHAYNVHDGGAPNFGRNLRAAVPGLRDTQPCTDVGGRQREYVGVRLKTHREQRPTI